MATTGRHSDDYIEVTPEMIEAGYGAVRDHEIDLYETTPRREVEEMVTAIYVAMRVASAR